MLGKKPIKRVLEGLLPVIFAWAMCLPSIGTMGPDVIYAAETEDDDILLFMPVILTAAQKAKGVSAPTGVTATAGFEQVTISWNAVKDATSYHIYWAPAPGAATTDGTRITGVTSPYIHTGLTNGTKYYYVVVAENASGESSPSTEASATPFAGWIQTQINPGLGRSLYATDTEIYAATYDGVFSTSDDGMPWFSRGLAGTDVSDIITRNGYILAATLAGVYRYSGGENTWTLMNGSPRVSAGGGIYGPHVFAQNATHLFMIAYADGIFGIFRSGDNGATWEQTPLGNDKEGYPDYADSATFIYTVGERVFINGKKPFDNGSVLWSSPDSGNTWSWSTPPADSIQSLHYTNGDLFACGSMGVYLSTDLGQTWSTRYSNTIDTQGKLIGVGMFRNLISWNNVLIAAVDFKSLYISRDRGITWTSFNEGLIPDWTFIGLAVKPPYIWALSEGFGNAYRRLLSELGD